MVGDLRSSKQGHSMRAYELRDDDGIALPVMMHGGQAEEAYGIGCRLALFSIVTKEGIRDEEEGSAWLYDDTTCICLSTKSMVPVLRDRVRIG